MAKPHLIIPCESCKGTGRERGHICECCFGSGIEDLSRAKNRALIPVILTSILTALFAFLTLALLVFSNENVVSFAIITLVTLMPLGISVSLYGGISRKVHLFTIAQQLKIQTGREPIQLDADGELFDPTEYVEEPNAKTVDQKGATMSKEHITVVCPYCKGELCTQCHYTGIVDLNQEVRSSLRLTVLLALIDIPVSALALLIFFAYSSVACLFPFAIAIGLSWWLFASTLEYLEARDTFFLHRARLRLASKGINEPSEIGDDGELVDLSPDQEKPKRQKL